MAGPLITEDTSTMFIGMSDEHFHQIPYRYWVLEFLVMMRTAIIGMIAVWFVEPMEVLKKFGSYLLAVIFVILLLTILMPLGPILTKYLVKDDNDSIGLFFLNSEYVANRMATFAAMVDVQVREFDRNNEQHVKELHWLIIERRF